MTQGAWIGRTALRPAGPEVLRLELPLLDWLRSVAGLPVRVDPAASAADARAERARLAEVARERGLVEGDPPRLAAAVAPAVVSVAAPSLVLTAVHSAFGAAGRFEVRAGEVAVVVRGEEYEPRPDLDLVAELLARLDLPRPPSTRVGEEGGVGPDPRSHPATPTPPPPTEDPATGTAPRSHPAAADPAAADPEHADPAHADPADDGPGAAEDDGPGAAEDAEPGGRWVLGAGALREAREAEDAGEVAARVGCPVELVRALARPVADGRVEVVSRAGAGLATGPTAVRVTEVGWVDGGPDGLWRLTTVELDLDGEPLAVELGPTTRAALAGELTRAVRDAEGC